MDTIEEAFQFEPIYLPQVLSCGTLVETKIGKLVGMVTCVSERFKSYKYEISYFVAGKQEVVWMDSQEFIIIIDGPHPVGFAQNKS